ncbi:hypothetical protein KSF_065890 [Reticulibacter mediterranei]|uniref:Uncharacterized protein n=1 Tax=Reticulibacter mediterranei TaxID=2778369 RepID=A0A8J3IUP4_9CHLR|nr:hypothetical protein [Reticulibacter mediterranei]GHO96541.1 hypothetical protein KSF_065890 [Reticulibacter mediterranei]
MKHTRIFDAGLGYGSISTLETLTDCTIVKRDDQWWMFAAGVDPEINLLSASLPKGVPLSDEVWQITLDPTDTRKPALLAGKSRSSWWDGKGGRHCPSYVKGLDPEAQRWVERIYYAGATHHQAGPYSIGYLQWNGTERVDQSMPVFTANAYWEHGSVYEPNLIYHDGKWKL